MRKVVAYLIVSIVVLSFGSLSKAQAQNREGIIMIAEVFHGDTFPVKYLPYLNIVGEKKFVSDYERRKWKRLQKNVKAVYPYAKMAGELLEKYSEEMANVESEREKKKFYKKIEKELKSEFEGTIKKMTTSQGRILVKLIDRETTQTGYEIVKEFRGGLTAFFWQGLGKMFGQDLKDSYDPAGEDAQIEQIVLLIEAGVI
jgi:hypothetical protein